MGRSWTGWRPGGVGLALLALTLAGSLATGVRSAAAGETSAQWSAAVLGRLLQQSSGKTVMVGDMVFKRTSVEAFRERLLHPDAPAPRGASGSGVTLWPGGVIPYTFDGTVTAPHQQQFRDAVAEWSAFAKVTFKVRTSEPDYVIVHNNPGGGNNSGVGTIGGPQYINIEAWNRGTLLHEVGHALGLNHEHQRADQATYVTIQTANITPGDEPFFTIIPDVTDIGPYDYFSVMHYSRNAFSIDPAKDTIVPNPPNQGLIDEIGNQYDRPLSTGDRATVQALYGAPTKAPGATVTNTKDSGPGSLRAAMEYAFDRSETSSLTTTINFKIPTSDPGFDGSTFTIHLSAMEPALGNRTVVNAGSQTAFTGDTNHFGPEIVLDGTNIDPNENYAVGIGFRGTSSKLEKVVLEHFAFNGVEMRGAAATANAVTGSYIGTDAAGTTAEPIGFAAVALHAGAHGNTIGGTAAGAGNIVSGNASEGVRLDDPGTSANMVYGNTIGLDRVGNPLPNAYSGVAVFNGAGGNKIGGPAAGAGNVISGNSTQGILIAGAGCDSNVIAGNRIGTDPTGAAARPNAYSGIGIWGGAKLNVVGGTSAGAGNLISGNAGEGLVITDLGTNSTKVQGNVIGLNATGSAALGNGGAGIGVWGQAQKTTIGGTTAASANTVSGNGGQGIVIIDANTKLNKLLGNKIGTNAAGTTALGNAFEGVAIFGGASANTIGGAASGAGNLISGNLASGVSLSGTGTKTNTVAGNKIGTNAPGSAALGNSGDGVAVFGGAASNIIGGTATGASNVISGNLGSGVTVTGTGTKSNTVSGNVIGLDATSSATIGNTYDGVALFGGSQLNTIGGAAAGAGNRIGGNGNNGVLLADATTASNTIQGNVIGRLAGGAAAPNGGDGVIIFGGAHGNAIGGPATGAGNDISNNGSHGVEIFDATSTGNAIRGNTMTANTGLGINLAGGTENGFGVTSNDGKDPDHGPDELQNYPVITSAVHGTSSTTINGTLNSIPSSTFSVDLFASASADPSTFGEGASYLGMVSVTTNANGDASFSFPTASLVPAGQLITATATDAAGDTSELCQRKAVT